MSTYNRLTNKEYLSKPKCFNCEHNYSNSITCERHCVDGDCFELRSELKRLVELEDKIEDGILVELEKPYIKPLARKNGRYIICKAQEVGMTGGLTKPEAEVRLCELNRSGHEIV